MSILEPLVSVVIPAFNAAPYIADAIRSALHQTCQDTEILIVDDGSADETLAVAHSFDDPRLRVLAGEHRGNAATVNRGILAARGKYVKFLDADDCLSPRDIESQVARLDGRDDIVSSGGYRRFYHSVEDAEPPRDFVDRDLPSREWLYYAFRSDQMIGTPVWLLPRALIRRSGLYDERLSLEADLEFLTRVLLRATEVRFAAGAMYYYRCGVPNSLTQQRTREAAESAALAVTLIAHHLVADDSSTSTRRVAANLLQQFTYNCYPDHADLRALIAARTRELGGSDLSPAGPKGFQLLRPIIGWRLARRVERWAVRHGLNRAARIHRRSG